MIPYRTRHMNSKPRYLHKSRMPYVFWLPWSLQVFRSLIVIKYSKNSAPATTLTARHMLLVSLDAAWHVEITLLISSASWYLKYLATALQQQLNLFCEPQLTIPWLSHSLRLCSAVMDLTSNITSGWFAEECCKRTECFQIFFTIEPFALWISVNIKNPSNLTRSASVCIKSSDGRPFAFLLSALDPNPLSWFIVNFSCCFWRLWHKSSWRC